MRIEILKAFGWGSLCFHPPHIPYPEGMGRGMPERYLNAPEDLPVAAAQWAVQVGAAQEVLTSQAAVKTEAPAQEEQAQTEEIAQEEQQHETTQLEHRHGRKAGRKAEEKKDGDS